MARLRGSVSICRLQQSEAIGMADVMFLAIGGGAFLAFAALAVFLKRV